MDKKEQYTNIIGQKRTRTELETKYTNEPESKRRKVQPFNLFQFLQEKFTDCPANVIFGYVSDPEHYINSLSCCKPEHIIVWEGVCAKLTEKYEYWCKLVCNVRHDRSATHIGVYSLLQRERPLTQKEKYMNVNFFEKTFISDNWSKPQYITYQEAIDNFEKHSAFDIGQIIDHMSNDYVSMKVLEKLKNLQLHERKNQTMISPYEFKLCVRFTPNNLCKQICRTIRKYIDKTLISTYFRHHNMMTLGRTF